MPKRIQRKRTKGWRMPEGAVYVGRPSSWGNPFQVGEPFRYFSLTHGWRVGVIGSVKHAATEFRIYLAGRIDMHEQVRRELGGKDLACWCPPEQACHADALLDLANEVLSDHAETCEVRS